MSSASPSAPTLPAATGSSVIWPFEDMLHFPKGSPIEYLNGLGRYVETYAPENGLLAHQDVPCPPAYRDGQMIDSAAGSGRRRVDPYGCGALTSMVRKAFFYVAPDDIAAEIKPFVEHGATINLVADFAFMLMPVVAEEIIEASAEICRLSRPNRRCRAVVRMDGAARLCARMVPAFFHTDGDPSAAAAGRAGSADRWVRC